MLIGDLNFTVEKKNLEVFMNTFDLECLTKEPACFQSTSPSCIDLILTNKKEFFKTSNGLEVGIYDIGPPNNLLPRIKTRYSFQKICLHSEY